MRPRRRRHVEPWALPPTWPWRRVPEQRSHCWSTLASLSRPPWWKWRTLYWLSRLAMTSWPLVQASSLGACRGEGWMCKHGVHSQGQSEATVADLGGRRQEVPAELGCWPRGGQSASSRSRLPPLCRRHERQGLGLVLSAPGRPAREASVPSLVARQEGPFPRRGGGRCW